MPTTHSDQFFVMDPGSPPAGGTALTVQNFSFIDNNDDGFIGTGVGDTFNGLTVTSVWVNDTITVNIPGTGNVTITGVTFYVSGGPAVFTPTDGTVLQDASFVSSSFVTSSTQVPVGTLGPVCFTRGTLIETPSGHRLIEELQAGDLVMTMDDGPQPLLMVSSEKFDAEGLNAPVRICKGALGNAREILVSQQHRMLITGWRAELLFGEPEVLVAAKHLVNGDTIYIQNGGAVEYFHLLFEDHQIVWAEDVPSESYHPAHFAEHEAVEVKAEIERLFPGLCSKISQQLAAARRVLRQHEAQLLTTMGMAA